MDFNIITCIQFYEYDFRFCLSSLAMLPKNMHKYLKENLQQSQLSENFIQNSPLSFHL